MNNRWPTKRLGDLFTFKNGRAFKKEEWTTKGLPIIRIQNLNNEDASFNYFAGDYSRDILVKSGDLLFSWSGTVGSSFGSHLWSGEPGVLNQHIFKIGLSDTITKRYAFHGLRYITAEIELSVNGAVGLVHITKEKLNEFKIPVPPVPEQERIAVVLDEAFAELATAQANAEKNLQNARALFESHLQSVFSHRGKGWVETTIGAVCDFRGGGTPSKSIERYWKGKIPWVSPKDMKSEVVSDSIDHISQEAIDGSATSLVPEGAVLMVVRSGILARIVPLAVTGRELTINQDLKALCPKNVIESRFLYSLLESKMPELLSMVSRGATVHRLQTDQIRSLGCYLPTKPEQLRIIEQIDTMRAETQRLARIYEQKQAMLGELKKSLLHQAFSGSL